MKKISLIFAALAMLFVGCSNDKTPVVKIGVYEPASGDNGAGGKALPAGMYVAGDVHSELKMQIATAVGTG